MSVEDLMTGLAELEDARPCYEEAERYYEGRVSEVFANAKLRRLLAGTGEAYKFNFAKTPVNVITNRLEISAVTTPEKQTTAVLQDQVWAPNMLDLEAPNVHLRAGEYGDAYLIVWPGEADSTVDVHYNSPLTTRVIYSEENPREKAYAVKCWAEGSRKRANLYYPDHLEKWVTKGKSKGSRRGDWEPYVDDTTDEFGQVPNPYDVVPVFHFRTDMPYGTPEHKDAYGPQNAITKTLIIGITTADAHGFPVRYALAEADVGSDEVDDFDEDDEEATQGEGDESTLKAEPGALWWLKGVKGAGQFDAADPDVFLRPLEVYIRSMAQLTDTPLHRFNLTGDHPSGESLRQAEAPLVKKIRNRQLSYGATWRETFEFALKILGAEAEVQVQWAPAVTVDDREGWDTTLVKIEAGMPRRHALIETGHTAEEVDAWLADATDEEDLRRRVVLLAELGNAVQRLGAGVQFGVIGEDQVQQAIAMILDNATPAGSGNGSQERRALPSQTDSGSGSDISKRQQDAQYEVI